MIDIENLTVRELRELSALACAVSGAPTPAAQHAGDCYPYKPGDVVLLATVTMWFVGRLQSVDAQGFVITEAAWLASTGRFSESLAHGTGQEIEPMPDGPHYIARGSLVFASPYRATLRVLK